MGRCRRSRGNCARGRFCWCYELPYRNLLRAVARLEQSWSPEDATMGVRELETSDCRTAGADGRTAYSTYQRRLRVRAGPVDGGPGARQGCDRFV